MHPQPTIGIVSPGEMGHAIGAVLVQHGLRVLTNLQGRSARTVALAARAGMFDVGDASTLVREADVLLSVLVPARSQAFAERIAEAMRATHSILLFADCNAVSPRTALSIERLLRGVGAEVVDVGIIGSPPRAGRAETRLYASGPGAERLAVLNKYGLDVRVIGPQVGQASGLKMRYASLTKGLTAPFDPGADGRRGPRPDRDLDRRAAREPAGTVRVARAADPAHAAQSLPLGGGDGGDRAHLCRSGSAPQMLEGAAALYRLVERTELGHETPEERHRGQTLVEVTAILAAALKQEADHPCPERRPKRDHAQRGAQP